MLQIENIRYNVLLNPRNVLFMSLEIHVLNKIS